MSFWEKSFVLSSSYIQLMLRGLVMSVWCLLFSDGYSVLKMAVHQYQVIYLEESVCNKNLKIPLPFICPIFFCRTCSLCLWKQIWIRGCQWDVKVSEKLLADINQCRKRQKNRWCPRYLIVSTLASRAAKQEPNWRAELRLRTQMLLRT